MNAKTLKIKCKNLPGINGREVLDVLPLKCQDSNIFVVALEPNILVSYKVNGNVV